MITLYHLSTSRSERIIWLMEELALPYEVERFQREPNGAAPDALREIHPLGQGPWFAGEQFTAADIMMTFPFTTMRLFLEYDLAPFRNIVAYLERIDARPAYRKAMTVAGTREK